MGGENWKFYCRGGGLFYQGDFFTGWREPEEEWFWQFKPFAKAKNSFLWILIINYAVSSYKLENCYLWRGGREGGGIKIWWGEQMFGWWVGDSLHSPSPVGKSLDSAMRRWYKIIVRYLSSSSSYFWTLCTSIYFKLLYAEAFLITNCSLVKRKHVWVRNC